MSTLRLSRIEISHFRGIPNTLVVEPVAEDAFPVSMLLVGDNGTGKSSIVDAIEFVLQGDVTQKSSTTSGRPSLLSFANKLTPYVRATLSDGLNIERHIIEDEQGYLFTERLPHPEFSVSPFVLRRGDILKFLQAPDAERVLVFWNYLRDPKKGRQWVIDPRTELDQLKEARSNAKVKRDRLRTELANTLEINEEEIPFDPKYFSEFLQRRIYGGFSIDELSKRGVKIKVDSRIEELANSFNAEAIRYRSLKSKINKFSINNDGKTFPKHLFPVLSQFLDRVAPRLTEAFKAVSSVSFLDHFEFDYGEGGQLALNISAVLTNARKCAPRQIFSEANQDLLALLFFVAVAEESADLGQAQFIIFDDVLQSVDNTIRLEFVDFVLERLNKWQIIFTAHDRLWYEQLRTILSHHKHRFVERHIVRWGFDDGPTIREGISTEQNLKDALETGNSVRICSDAGILLELICNVLSVNLPITIIRRRGDRYNLGDLWPGLRKALRNTEIETEASAIDKLLHLRNLLGSHYNDWARSVSLSEAESFGHSVLRLLEKVRCSYCARFVESVGVSEGWWKCRCGAIQFSKRRIA